MQIFCDYNSNLRIFSRIYGLRRRRKNCRDLAAGSAPQCMPETVHHSVLCHSSKINAAVAKYVGGLHKQLPKRQLQQFFAVLFVA